jgi:hypothetical protein
MTTPRIYTARRRTLHDHDALPDTITLSIPEPSNYGSDIEIDTDLLAANADARTKEIDACSDYGSDFDIEGEAILDGLLEELEGRLELVKEEDGDTRSVAFMPKTSQENTGATTDLSCVSKAAQMVCDETGNCKENEGGKRTWVTRKCVFWWKMKTA